MAYSVALRIGLLSSCYTASGGWPIVYPRGVSGNDGYLYNDDIIQMIEYCSNSSGLRFSSIETWIEMKEVQSGATTIYGKGIADGFSPSWTYSYACWYAWPCCDQSKGIPAWELCKDATIEFRVWYGSPVNLYSDPATIVIGDPQKRAAINRIEYNWLSSTQVEISVIGDNVESPPSEYYYYLWVYDSNGDVVTAQYFNNSTAKVSISNPDPNNEYYFYLRSGSIFTDIVSEVIPEYVCKDGTTQCYEYDSQECVDNQWTTVEENSPACGFVCEEGSTRCIGTTLQECQNNTWIPIEENSQSCGFICENGAIDVLEYCPDGTTPKRWLLCENNQWIEKSQTCPEEEPSILPTIVGLGAAGAAAYLLLKYKK